MEKNDATFQKQQKKMLLNAGNDKLIRHIQLTLYNHKVQKEILPRNVEDMLNQSAVLFPVGPKCNYSDNPGELCLILNKRSKKVKQAGDLCCPGGGVSLGLDKFLSKLLTFPFSPLTRWIFWTKCRSHHPGDARKLAILYATSLRESFEEMRLNPLGANFMGVLPPQQLMTRNRYIFPMVAWIPRQKRFFPNWEVEKIVHLPFRDLLKPDNYAAFELSIPEDQEMSFNGHPRFFPCYLHHVEGDTEVLWGATYRIVMDFLGLIFGFTPPDAGSLPVIKWELDKDYMTGIRASA